MVSAQNHWRFYPSKSRKICILSKKIPSFQIFKEARLVFYGGARGSFKKSPLPYHAIIKREFKQLLPCANLTKRIVLIGASITTANQINIFVVEFVNHAKFQTICLPVSYPFNRLGNNTWLSDYMICTKVLTNCYGMITC